MMVSSPVESAPNGKVSQRLGRAQDIIRLLEDGGCCIRLGPPPPASPAATRFSPEEFDRCFGDVDAAGVGTGETISGDVVAGSRRLVTVCCYYIGTEFIDVQACPARGVVVGFGAVPDNYLGVAEAIVMLGTTLMKELPGKHAALRGGGWGVGDAGRMVAANTIGMIGLGNVGRAPARRLAGWDGRVLCYDPYVRQADADPFGVALVNPDTLLRSAERIANISALRRRGRPVRGPITVT
jgi:D-3-phosphoglycerate dehydrogenase